MDTGLVSEKYKPIIRSFLALVSDDLSMVLEWAEGRQGENLRQIASGQVGSQ
jgi:hypothetical protein